MKLKPLPLAVAAVLAARATLPLATPGTPEQPDSDPSQADPSVSAVSTPVSADSAPESDSQAPSGETVPADTDGDAPEPWPYLAEINGQSAEIFVTEWPDGRYSIAVEDAQKFGWIAPDGARGQVVLSGVEAVPERLVLSAQIPVEPTVLDVEIAAPAMAIAPPSKRVQTEIARASAAESPPKSRPARQIGQAETADAPVIAEDPVKTPQTTPQPPQSWPFVVDINGRKAEIFVTQAGDQYSISAEDAKRFGGRSDLSGTVLLENVQANQFDLTLTADLPVSALDPSRITNSSRENSTLLAQHDGWAGWLNYTVDGRYSERTGTTYSLLTDVNISAPFGGVLRSYHIVGDGSVESRRLMTSYTLDMPESMTTLTLGDAYSSSYALASGTRFAGVQLRRNYALNPDYVYFPTIDLAGSASAPSVYEIYEGNRRVSGGSLERGEFSLEDYSAFLGQSGQIRLIVRDAQGNEQVITRDLFTAPTALKPGEFAYALDTGLAYRTDNALGDLYGSGALRYGLSRFTAEGGIDLLEGDSSAFAGLVLPAPFGNLSYRHTRGEDDRTIDRVSWEKRFAFDARRDLRFYASAEFGDLETAQIGAAYSTGKWSTFATALRAGADDWNYSGGASLSLDRFSVSGTLSHSGDTGLVAGLQLSVPLGRSTLQASASDDRYGLGLHGSGDEWAYSGNVYNTHNETEASGSVRKDFSRARGEVYADYRRGQTAYRGRALGSIVATGDGVTLARPVTSGVLLVDTGIEGVPVRASGRTHRAHIDSQTVITNLPTYASTLIQPDYDALPGGYTADVDRQSVRIPQGVSQVAFDVRAPGFFAQILHYGTPVERGVEVRADGEPVVISSAGAYIQPRAGRETVTIAVGGCEKAVPVPEKALVKVEVEVCGSEAPDVSLGAEESDEG